METLDYNQLLLVSLWQYNHHGDEGLTPALFEETFGKVYGSHYYEKMDRLLQSESLGHDCLFQKREGERTEVLRHGCPSGQIVSTKTISI